MLKHFAAALIAASVIAAPAFARTASPSTAPKPTAAAVAAPAKAAAPTKSVKHVKKSKRHAMKVRGKHGKSARTVGASKALGQAGKTGVRVAPRIGTHG